MLTLVYIYDCVSARSVNSVSQLAAVSANEDVSDSDKATLQTCDRLHEDVSTDIDIDKIDFFNKPLSTGQKKRSHRATTFSSTAAVRVLRPGGNRSQSMLAGVRPRTLVYKRDDELTKDSRSLLRRKLRKQSKFDDEDLPEEDEHVFKPERIDEDVR